MTEEETDSDIEVIETLGVKMNYIPKHLTVRGSLLDDMRETFIEELPILKCLGMSLGGVLDPTLSDVELENISNQALSIVSTILSVANLDL